MLFVEGEYVGHTFPAADQHAPFRIGGRVPISRVLPDTVGPDLIAVLQALRPQRGAELPLDLFLGGDVHLLGQILGAPDRRGAGDRRQEEQTEQEISHHDDGAFSMEPRPLAGACSCGGPTRTRTWDQLIMSQPL